MRLEKRATYILGCGEALGVRAPIERISSPLKTSFRRRPHFTRVGLNIDIGLRGPKPAYSRATLVASFDLFMAPSWICGRAEATVNDNRRDRDRIIARKKDLKARRGDVLHHALDLLRAS